MGFLKAIKRRKAAKIAAKKLALQEGPNSPQSLVSTNPSTPDASLKQYHLHMPSPFDKTISHLDCESHATSESYQMSLQDSNKVDRIIDTINLETALSKLEEDLSISMSSMNVTEAGCTMTETGCTIQSLQSETSSLHQMWRYLTCDYEHESEFSILQDDESTFTIGTEDGTVVTMPKAKIGGKGIGLNKIQETDEFEDAEEVEKSEDVDESNEITKTE